MGLMKDSWNSDLLEKDDDDDDEEQDRLSSGGIWIVEDEM